MFWSAFWFYTLFIIVIWAFFVLTRIHAYKFKNFSNNVKWVTNLLFVTLLILTLIWYWYIFSIDDSKAKVNKESPSTKIEYY